MSTAACRNSEGWGPLSSLRHFDFTPCFEEGIILSSTLAIFSLVAGFSCWKLSSKHERYHRSRKSLIVLWLKLVCIIAFYTLMFLEADTFCSFCSHSLQPRVAPISCSLSHTTYQWLSFSIISSRLSPFFLLLLWSTSIITDHGPPQPRFSSFGQFILLLWRFGRVPSSSVMA